jgi:hypothetical protein
VEVEISDDHVQTQEINSCPGRREHSRRAWQPSQLQHLEQPFSEEEIMVNSDDVQRKDRFYWTFFFYMLADDHGCHSPFLQSEQSGLHLLNNAYVVLILKKENPHKIISNYRPINLIHNFDKFVSKLLADRLGQN